MKAPPAPQPPPLPAPAFDAHTHLDMLPGPVESVLADARAAGITRVVTIGCDVESSRWAADRAAEHADVYAAVAIHPNETARGEAKGRDAVLAAIAELAAQPKVRAIGETGLDYYRDYAAPELQREWFRAHIEIARAAGKALMIHDRDAHADVLDILLEQDAPEHVICHCFSGDTEMAKRCTDAGYVMSFAGNVTFPSAGQLRDAAAVAPAELILVETDAPYLTPVPNRGRMNAPAQVAHTLRAIAEVRQMDVAELCAAVMATGERVFGAWQDLPAP
ncbi:MAG: TatD family hydrolase [Nocardiopsaceae bacterium]|jgi:TatD DNase family protein|nr:TatD family hydrolase [Nocardiopsaceae bacterium]